MLKKKLIIISAFILVSTLVFISAYTPPVYNQINFTLCSAYVPPVYNQINFTLGTSEPSCGGVDVCAYSSGNWTISCANYCNLTTNTNILNNWFIASGNGIINIRANISSTGGKIKDNGCTINIFNEGGFQ